MLKIYSMPACAAARPLSRLEGVSRLRILRSLYMWFGSSAEFRIPDTSRVHLLSFMYIFLRGPRGGRGEKQFLYLTARGGSASRDAVASPVELEGRRALRGAGAEPERLVTKAWGMSVPVPVPVPVPAPVPVPVPVRIQEQNRT